MRGNLKQAILWTLPAALLSACGGAPQAPASDDAPLEQGQAGLVAAPPTPPSGNIADSVVDQGVLPVGGAVAGYPGSQPGYFGYTIQANAGAQLRLEVTHLGSSMYLDTGLFLYGPKDADGSFGVTPLAQDDDSGYGTLSKVELVTVPKTGEYLAVVGFVNAANKQFRLAASCVGGTCLVNPPAPPAGLTLSWLEQPITERLQSVVDQGNDWFENETGSLRRLDYYWTFTGQATLDQAVQAVLAQGRYQVYRSDPAPAVLSLSETSSSMWFQFRPLLPVILETYGNGTETVQVKRYFREYSTGPNGDTHRILYIMLFPQSYKVIVFEQTWHEL
nr:PPC domain-containing protein [Myxococcus sp. MH1]